MYISTWKRTVALLAASVFLATGCAQLQPVPLRQNGQSIERPDVKAGESVVVTTRNGDTRKFRVTAVEEDALRGENERVPFTEIASLEVRRNDGQFNKTALIVGAVLVGAAVIGAASGGGGGGGY